MVAMELLSEEKHSSEHCDIVVVEDGGRTSEVTV